MPKDYTPEEWLAHYGVKGMKWGVHRNDAQLSKSRKERRAEKKEERRKRDKEIGAARIRQDKRARDLDEAAAKYYLARTGKGEEKALELIRKKENALWNNPDAKMAQQMTRGEKVANGAAWAAAGIMTVGYAAIVAAANR